MPRPFAFAVTCFVATSTCLMMVMDGGFAAAYATTENGCTSFSTETLCVADSACVWDPVTVACYEDDDGSNSIHGNNTNGTTHNSTNPNCTTNNGTYVGNGTNATCGNGTSGNSTSNVTHCWSHRTEASCLANGSCDWDPSSSTCFYADDSGSGSGNDNRTANCTANGTYVGNGTNVTCTNHTSNGTTAMECTLLTSKSECLANASCVWDSVTVSCFDKSNTTSPTATHARSTVPAGTTTTHAPPAGTTTTHAPPAGTTTTHAPPAGTTTTRAATPTTDNAKNATTTAASHTSMAPHSTTSCAALMNTVACSADSSCMWNFDTDMCTTACVRLDMESACMQDSMCSWDTTNALCRLKCEFGAASETLCDVDSQCLWDPVMGICEAACARRATAEGCLGGSLCQWLPSEGRCDNACSLQSTSASCSAEHACEWFPSLTTCNTKCELLNAQNCAAFPLTCIVSADSQTACRTACVYKYSSSSPCDADADCVWSAVSQLCQQSCQSFVVEATCVAASTCSWNRTSGLCGNSVASIRVNSSDLAAQIADPVRRPILELAFQADLSNVFAVPVTVIDGRLTIDEHKTSVVVPFTTTIATNVPAVVTQALNRNASWLQATYKVYRSFGGTQELVVSSIIEPSPPAAPSTPTSSGMALHTIVLIAGCSAAALLVVSACAVWGWRHNPYAAARAPVQTTERFTGDEYDRLKAINERVVTYEEAVALATTSDPRPRPPEWAVVARCEMPKNTQRGEQRGMWDAMCTTLFPSVFEHLTSLCIAVDVDGTVRSDPADAHRILRYSHAVRLHAQGKGKIEFVMSGGSRFRLIRSNIDDGRVNSWRDFRGLGGAINAAFEGSGYCTHTGTNEPRKIVFGRIRPSDTFVVAAVSDAAALELPYLQGIPPQWTSGMAESAVRLMLRVASVLLESRRDFSDSLLSVHRGMHDDEWRIRADDSVIDVLSAVATRFWAIDDVLFFCGAAGIPISCLLLNDDDDDDLYRSEEHHVNAPLVG